HAMSASVCAPSPDPCPIPFLLPLPCLASCIKKAGTGSGTGRRPLTPAPLPHRGGEGGKWTLTHPPPPRISPAARDVASPLVLPEPGHRHPPCWRVDSLSWQEIRGHASTTVSEPDRPGLQRGRPHSRHPGRLPKPSGPAAVRLRDRRQRRRQR